MIQARDLSLYLSLCLFAANYNIHIDIGLFRQIWAYVNVMSDVALLRGSQAAHTQPICHVHA